MSGHGHHHDHNHGGTGQDAGRLRFAILLLSATLAAELAGGLLTHSLALLADAGHVFMDLFAMGISLGAMRLARLPATSRKTFGWHRLEVLAALLNGALLTVLALSLFREAWLRSRDPMEILAGPMLVVAVAGLAINVLIAFRLHGHHAHDLNVRSAYLHVLGDTAASVGVVAAAVVIRFTGWTLIDPLISACIGVLILVGSVRLVLKAGHILVEGVPSRLSLHAVAEAIAEIQGVNNVHDLHIWTVCSHIVSLSCHIHIDPGTPAHHDGMVRAVADMLWRRFCILHATIQVDYESCSEAIITQDMAHPAA